MALSRRTGGRSRLTHRAPRPHVDRAAHPRLPRRGGRPERARGSPAPCSRPSAARPRPCASPFSNAWHGITDYGDLKVENERPPGAARGGARASEVLDEDAAEPARRDPRAAEPRVGRRHRHHHRPGAVERPVELLPHHRHQQGQRRRPEGRHAGGERRRARRADRAGHPEPLDRAAHHRPRLPRRRPPPRQRPGHRHRATARARARTSSSTRASNPTSTTRRSPAPRSPPAARSSAPFPDSIPVGKVRTVREAGGGLTLELVVRPDGRHRADAVRHRAPLGAADVIPPSPLTVAVRTSFVLVTALTLQLGVLVDLALFGVQADLMLLVAIAGGHRGRPRPRRRHRLRGRASPTTSCSRRPSASRPSPTRSSPTSSAASRTRCSAPPGGSRWPPRPPRASFGVILYGVLGHGPRRRPRRLGAPPDRR